jgi:hypothetical protein
MLYQLQVHRQILFDLTNLYLSPMKGIYERLAYLAGLRDPVTGLYVHPALSAQYPQDRVSEALQHSHEEIFERLLESPLSALEQDLTRYFDSVASKEGTEAQLCVQRTESWMPEHAPNYLKELYCSNQAALCALLQANKSKAR